MVYVGRDRLLHGLLAETVSQTKGVNMNWLIGLGAFLMYIVVMIIGVCIMIYGWGLTPLNWWWIIGGMVIATMINAGSALAGKLLS